MSDNFDLSRALQALRNLANKDREAIAQKRGVDAHSIIGVPTVEIRKLAKRIGKNSALARLLWQERYLECKWLAILLEEFKNGDHESLDDWVFGIGSWDVCDLFAKELVLVKVDVAVLAPRWISQTDLYVRRAGLALLANYFAKIEQLTESEIERYLGYIESASIDARPHVRQATCWALRELGKMNENTHEQAILLALSMMDSEDPARLWIGKCAHRELETLMKIPERRRLISRKAKTAKKHL